MEFNKFCERCKTMYVAQGRRSRFCEPCRIARRLEGFASYNAHMKQQKAEAAAKPKPKTLKEISALARKSGMSYGQYVAKYRGKL